MASPQKENGHIQIATEIVEALMRVNLSPYESRVLWFIFRKTYGWQKKVDWIALSQFSKEIGLDRRLIHRAVKSLSSKKMIVINKDDGFKIRYGFQKNYEKWKVSSGKMTVIYRDDAVSSAEMMEVSSVQMNTIDTITKETLTKEKKTYSVDSKEVELSLLLLNCIKKRAPEFKEPNLQKWAKHIDLMIRVDERPVESIKNVIQWCQQDKFWQNNVLGTAKLRLRYDQLFLKMNQNNWRPEPQSFPQKPIEELIS